jgi:quercetin 2,3-dioxygenase
MKKLSFVQRNKHGHWVGDGFPVRSIFSYNERSADFSPFLLLDYAGPMTFKPSNKKLGVGEHPHRGFETVTIVYSGEVAHRDSSGGGGTIGPGDVQWMTAGGGIVHEEFHSPAFAQNGGVLEMVQLWVNLPTKDKMTPAGYQALVSDQIPVADLPDDAGFLRVIAGQYGNANGPAHTFTPINVWDVRLKAGKPVELPVKDGHNASLLVLKGRVRLAGGEEIGEAEIAVLERDGENVVVEGLDNATVLVLDGQPIEEPVFGYGPFVMNNESEIRQAIADYQTGKMGHLPQPVH